MAAHDDKISDNRRRLFKALSATPVVMTLRPGTAAASSAYQCVNKLPPPIQLWKTTTSPDCTDGIGCYVYQERNYWIVSGCGYSGTPAIVVETQPGPPAVYFTGPGDLVSSVEFLPPSAGGGLKRFTVGTTTYTCPGQGVTSQAGLFLLVGEAQPSDEPIFFDYKGVYPEQQIGGNGLQGISGTCLDSIPDNVVGAFTLAKG